MVLRIQILISQILISFLGFTQSDTNLLYIDYLEISYEDSTEKFEYIKIENDSNELLFSDVSKIKMVALNKSKYCHMILKTNKTQFLFQDMNEYISFIDTKYRISINLPEDHYNCLDAYFLRPDGMIYSHYQSMQHRENKSNLINCIELDAGPTGYASFEKFEYNYVLK